MFPGNFSAIINTSLDWLGPVLFMLGIFMGIFLFWRAGRLEFFETEKLFDIVAVSLVGAVLFSRIFDFLIRSQVYQWSFKKLIFFNAYWGFDYYGSLFGLAFFALIYLVIKKENILQIFDLAAAPVVFVQIIYYLSKVVQATNRYFFYFIFYFLIFFAIKRLSIKKRHDGFFVCFYLAVTSASNLVLRLFFSLGKLPRGPQMWHAIFDVAILIFGLFLWYILAKRKPKEDIKAIFAFILLSIFRTRRILTSLNEADRFAKSILFVPLNIVRSLYLFFRFMTWEIYLGFLEFVNVFKGKR